LAPTVPEERVKISWVTLDRICQEEADGKEDVRRELAQRQAADVLRLCDAAEVG
jgi:hypothetical protein